MRVFVGLKLCSAVILQLIKYAQFLFFVSPLTFPYCNIYHCLLPSGHVFTHLLFFLSLFFFKMLQISLSSHVSWATSLDLILFLDRQKKLLVSSGCAVPWVQMNRLDAIRDSVSLATAKEL